MMANETWLSAKEMKEKGFIDTILSGKGAKAEFDLSIFSKVPDELKLKAEEKQEPTIRDIEKALRDVGLSNSKAKALLARGWVSKAEINKPDNEAPQPNIPPDEIIQWDDSIVARLTRNISQMRSI